MNSIVQNTLASVLQDGKIYIPDFIKRVKLDIGLSINAPNTEYWLSRENDLYVYGFEPSSHMFRMLCDDNAKTQLQYPQYVYVHPSRIFHTFHPIKCALSTGEPRKQLFYNTNDVLGTASLYKPTYIKVTDVEEVVVISLKHFFDLFPWHQIQYIDQVKIDAQGSDFDIIVGAEHYLDRIVYLTVEHHANRAYEKEEDTLKFDPYLQQFNFRCISKNTHNSTYLNQAHEDKIENINFYIQDL